MRRLSIALLLFAFGCDTYKLPRDGGRGSGPGVSDPGFPDTGFVREPIDDVDVGFGGDDTFDSGLAYFDFDDDDLDAWDWYVEDVTPRALPERFTR